MEHVNNVAGADKRTIDTYNKMAHEYDVEVADFWDRFPRMFIDSFAERVHGDVLDIGSGSGRDGLLLQKKGLRVVCLDASEAMVKLCSEKGLESVLADFMQLPFAPDSFDGVWAYTSLLHVPKQSVGQALQEIKRVLKDKCIFGLGLIEGEEEIYRETVGVGMPRLFSFYSKDEVEALLQALGFKVVHFEKFKPRSRNYLNFLAENIKS